MDKLVVDTCVFIEGIFGDNGNSSSLFLMEIDRNNSKLIFSMDMIGELLYILKRECNKIRMTPDETYEILTDAVAMFQNGKSVSTKNVNGIDKTKDPDDQMFVDAAHIGKASHIITLDKKSGILSLEIPPTKCMTPGGYLREKVRIS